MDRQVDQELDQIRQDLLRMGAEVEAMVGEAIRALLDRDSEAAQTMPARDKGVDDLEKRIDEKCYLIMARQQPTAVDLRFLIAVTRIINDLERVGDLTKNIAKSALVLNEEPPLEPSPKIPRMATIARGMLRDGLDSFTNRDSALALEVCQRDNDIDAMWAEVFQELLASMLEDGSITARALQYQFVAHDLERVADHATNIAEDVIYYLEARDIRHTPEGTGASTS